MIQVKLLYTHSLMRTPSLLLHTPFHCPLGPEVTGFSVEEELQCLISVLSPTQGGWWWWYWRPFPLTFGTIFRCFFLTCFNTFFFFISLQLHITPRFAVWKNLRAIRFLVFVHFVPPNTSFTHFLSLQFFDWWHVYIPRVSSAVLCPFSGYPMPVLLCPVTCVLPFKPSAAITCLYSPKPYCCSSQYFILLCSLLQKSYLLQLPL